MDVSITINLEDLIEMKADKDIRRIYHKKYNSVFTCVIGPNQSGKTALNLFIMERLHQLNLFDGFGTNMKIYDPPFEIDFIEDYETLERRCKMLNPDPDRKGLKRYLYFGSEIGNWAPKDQPWLNVEFLRKLQLVRKLGLSFLTDGIERIDERIFSPVFFHGYFHKPYKDKPQKATYFDWTKGGKPTRINGIPNTSIKFDTFYPAMFYMTPQNPDITRLPLNKEHEIAFAYLDCGQVMRKTGFHPETVKRAIGTVLTYHREHCINHIQES